jgi:ABC-type transporter MlaC component
MRRTKAWRAAVALAGALFAVSGVNGAGARAAVAPEVDTGDPVELVGTVARNMLTDIDAHREQYRTDSVKLDRFVRTILLPHFDTVVAARLVLARHWNAASLAQRPYISLCSGSVCISRPRPMY